MTETKKRRLHSPEFKAKVGLQALGDMRAINQIAEEHDVHAMQVRQWKRDIQDQAKTLFEGKRGLSQFLRRVRLTDSTARSGD